MKTEYKTKKHFSTFLTAVSCLVLLFSISSCELFTFSKLEENENTANTTEQLCSSNTINLHITPRFGNETLHTQGSSRSAFPDFSSFDFSLYTFKATSSVLAQDATGTYNSQSGDISYSFSAPTSSEPVDFTFYICDLSGKELFYGTQQITYTTLGSEIEKTVYFKSYDSSEVNGHIDLKVAVTSGYTLSCEIKNSSNISVCGNTGDPISVDSSGNITTGTDGIAPGTYKAYISVNKGSQLYDYIIQDINVWPDLTTNRWYLPDGTTSQTYNIEISENKIKLYVKGASPSGLYGSSGLTGVAEPLDTNSGAIMHPLASLSAAISKCTDSSAQYTIICDGSIAGCNIGSQSTPNDCTITIRGGGNKAGYSRISTGGFTIYTNKAITLENIKISTLTQTAIQYTSSATSADLSLKNCEITNNKMVGNVGGIQLNSANLHLQGKIVITGNAYRNNSSDTTGSPQNVVINSPNLIIIDGPLDSSSRIGVTYSELSPTSFCPGFATNCPGLDPKIIFSADFENYEITENDSGEPCITQRPPYATVQDIPYYSLLDTINAINAESGTISVVLYGAVTQNELGPSETEGTILYAIRSKTAETDSLNLSVADGESITLAGSVFNFFESCKRLITADLRGFDTSDVTDMKRMFAYCENLSTLNISNFNTQKVNDMSYMFYYCKKLSEINVTSFNTSAVTNMNSMFYNCYSQALVALNLSSFNTSNVTDMKEMFYSCRFVQKIYVSNSFTTDKVTSSDNMFKTCSNLKGSNGTDPLVMAIYDKTYARIDGVPTGTKGYFTSSAELP